MIARFILIIGILTLCIWGNKSFAQTPKDTLRKRVFVVYAEVPEFPGGLEKFQEFIQSNLKTVDGAAGKRVIVSFVVEKDGSVNDVKIARGVNAEADQEALRVIKRSPKWKPIMQTGKF
jgi:protein TonB